MSDYTESLTKEDIIRILGLKNEIEPLLTKEEVLALLGVKDGWLQQEMYSGRLPYIRLGKKKLLRFRREHVEAYISDREHIGGPQSS
jgi:excisionase family DNA binding protein